MHDLSVCDFFTLAYLAASVFWMSFKLGGWLSKLAILWLFCRDTKLHDLAWKLFTVCEMRYGKLQGEQTYTIDGKEYSIRIKRRQPDYEPKPAAAPPETEALPAP